MEPGAPTLLGELDAALLQATITLGLVAVCVLLYARFRKPHFFWWAVAWSLYLARLAAMLVFVQTGHSFWLYLHQVATGWTALALLWSALVFSRGVKFRPVFWLLLLFPPLWSFFAIFHLGVAERFLYAAVPAVAFLSGATLWTAWVFFRFRRMTGSPGALLLGFAFLFWGLHHLDYPVLRARGAWNPWGYYLDIVFALLVGGGILILVVEDLERGLRALSALSGDLQGGERSGDGVGALLARALVLPGVRGSALYDRREGIVVRSLAACAPWEARPPVGEAMAHIETVLATGRPSSGGSGSFAYVAALPIMQREAVGGVMLIVGDARDPFAALDASFLQALGQQVGAALENADLGRRLRRRTEDLERLSVRMVEQHEEERRRLSLELHDETAQVFSAVKLQLGIVREQVPPPEAERLARVADLVDEGMASIRSVTDQLRPSLLDDLGLLPALRALVGDFEGRTGIGVTWEGPETLTPLPALAELAVFRAVQEGLSNVARHADAAAVRVTLGVEGERLSIRIEDDGQGLGADGAAVEEHTGLAGMRERFSTLGGEVMLLPRAGGGTCLALHLPLVTGTR